MMRIRKLLVVVGLVAVLAVVLLAGRQLEKMGNPDSTGDPASTSSYTLEAIYNRLNAGTDGSQSTFTDPGAGPGTPTMHTLNDIMGKAPVADNTDGATKAEVAHDKKYWSVRTDGSGGSGWGEETGSLYGGCTCAGTMNGTRWCDNGDGTVTDLTTCLVWLKDAGWGGQKPWRNHSLDCGGPDYTCYDDAHARAGLLTAEDLSAGLSDGSEVGDWRLPTLEELKALTTIDTDEFVRSGDMHAFTNVQSAYYWSSTTNADTTDFAWTVNMNDGSVYSEVKHYDNFSVWPVRGP